MSYKSTDGIIPHKLFQLRYRELDIGMAFDRLHLAKAHRLGFGWANVPDKPFFMRELRDERGQAGVI